MPLDPEKVAVVEQAAKILADRFDSHCRRADAARADIDWKRVGRGAAAAGKYIAGAGVKRVGRPVMRGGEKLERWGNKLQGERQDGFVDRIREVDRKLKALGRPQREPFGRKQLQQWAGKQAAELKSAGSTSTAGAMKRRSS